MNEDRGASPPAPDSFDGAPKPDRPIVITQNGRPAGVVISPEEFDRLRFHERFMTAVNQGLEDSEASRGLPDEELDAEVDKWFGPEQV